MKKGYDNHDEKISIAQTKIKASAMEVFYMTKNNQTDTESIKEQSRRSGLSYNEAKKYIARSTGGHRTNVYSNTDIEAVKRKNQKSEDNKL